MNGADQIKILEDAKDGGIAQHGFVIILKNESSTIITTTRTHLQSQCHGQNRHQYPVHLAHDALLLRPQLLLFLERDCAAHDE